MRRASLPDRAISASPTTKSLSLRPSQLRASSDIVSVGVGVGIGRTRKANSHSRPPLPPNMQQPDWPFAHPQYRPPKPERQRLVSRLGRLFRRDPPPFEPPQDAKLVGVVFLQRASAPQTRLSMQPEFEDYIPANRKKPTPAPAPAPAPSPRQNASDRVKERAALGDSQHAEPAPSHTPVPAPAPAPVPTPVAQQVPPAPVPALSLPDGKVRRLPRGKCMQPVRYRPPLSPSAPSPVPARPAVLADRETGERPVHAGPKKLASAPAPSASFREPQIADVENAIVDIASDEDVDSFVSLSEVFSPPSALRTARSDGSTIKSDRSGAQSPPVSPVDHVPPSMIVDESESDESFTRTKKKSEGSDSFDSKLRRNANSFSRIQTLPASSPLFGVESQRESSLPPSARPLPRTLNEEKKRKDRARQHAHPRVRTDFQVSDPMYEDDFVEYQCRAFHRARSSRLGRHYRRFSNVTKLQFSSSEESGGYSSEFSDEEDAGPSMSKAAVNNVFRRARILQK